MTFWRRRSSDPEGAIPTKRVAALALAGAAASLAVYIAMSPGTPEGVPSEVERAPPLPAYEDPADTAEMAAGAVSDAEAVAREQAAAAARAKLEAEASAQQARERLRQESAAREAASAALQRPAADPFAPPAGPGGLDAYYPPPGGGTFVEEYELQKQFRLDALRDRNAALKSPPVAQSERQPPPPPPPPPVEASPPAPAPLAPTSVSGQPPLAAPPAAAPSAAGQLARATARPDPGEGWEVIDEGSMLEATLVTQLRGDFAGPVQALVATPMWSRDRQRVLVPRGTRVLGTVAPVSGFGQARLAVGFHRMILPDGARVELRFAGLSQSGESALKDRVNRHYLSTFGAAGAVGALAGLTQLGAARPTALSPGDARYSAGQRIGTAAESVFERFLNRAPTLTIRAGHRVRIYFTSDAAVPRTTLGLPAALSYGP